MLARACYKDESRYTLFTMNRDTRGRQEQWSMSKKLGQRIVAEFGAANERIA